MERPFYPMIIDFHTHIFPPKIAAAALEKLKGFSHIEPDTDGTLPSLRATMKKNKIDMSVVLPVVTGPKQFDSINRFAVTVNSEPDFFAFGGIHPDCENIEEKVKFIKSLGLCGIKIHPDYQGVYIDDDRYAEILRCCIQNDLYLITHSGYDCMSPNDIHCTPQRILNLLSKVYGNQKPSKIHLILAHCGANMLWDETETLLCGIPAYFDLAFMIRKIPDEKLISIIRRHGVERILFASDSPWSDPGKDIAHLCSLPLTEQEKKKILGENAALLLHI